MQPVLDETSAPPRNVSSTSKLRRWWWVLLALMVCVPCVYWQFRQWRHESILAFKRQCKALSEVKNWAELANVAAKWSTLEPQSTDPWLYRSEAAEGLDDWNALVQYLDRIPKSDPRAIGALVRKSVVEFEKLNRPLESMKTCDEILELEPRVLIAHKQSIFFYAMTLQRAEMVRRVRRAIRLRRESPESYVFLVSASWLYPGSMYRTNTRWLESDPKSETFEVAQAMQIYTSQAKSDPERAKDFEHILPAEELLRRYPHNLELLAYFLNRAITEGDLDRVQELLKAVQQEQAGKDARFWRAKAWCEDARGEYDLAEKSLRRALTLDPYWWLIHFQLHDLLRRLGRLEESAEFFKIHKIAKELSIEIMELNESPESLDEKKFCHSLLVLAELVTDEEVASVLRERVSAP